MSVIAALSGGTRFSVEVVPPPRGAGLDELYRAVETVMPHAPAFVSVTDHPGGLVYAESENGPVLKSLRAKPGTLGTALALANRFGVLTVPHIVATGKDRFSVEDLLIDLHYAGIRDLFLVRGDERNAPGTVSSGPAASSGGKSGSAQGYASATELVEHAAALNRGEYLSGHGDGETTAFEIGVAGYPEKHFEAPNLDTDIERLRKKIEAGASYVVTQMVFDPEDYFRFVERLRALGVTVPILPGIKPITRAAQVSSIPGRFFVDIPAAFVHAITEARSPAEERASGLAWAVKTTERLLDGGAPGVHFFTMGRGGATRAVLDALFGPQAGRERRYA